MCIEVISDTMDGLIMGMSAHLKSEDKCKLNLDPMFCADAEMWRIGRTLGKGEWAEAEYMCTIVEPSLVGAIGCGQLNNASIALM